MKLRSSLLGITAAALLAAAASLSRMSSASAAVTPAPHVSHVLSSATGTPKTRLRRTSVIFTYIRIAACIQGEVYGAVDPVASVINNCEYHIYLQYSDGSSFCINPHSDRTDIGSRYREPVSIQVGPGTSSCIPGITRSKYTESLPGGDISQADPCHVHGPGGGVKMAWVPMRRQMMCGSPARLEFRSAGVPADSAMRGACPDAVILCPRAGGR